MNVASCLAECLWVLIAKIDPVFLTSVSKIKRTSSFLNFELNYLHLTEYSYPHCQLKQCGHIVRLCYLNCNKLNVVMSMIYNGANAYRSHRCIGLWDITMKWKNGLNRSISNSIFMHKAQNWDQYWSTVP